MYELYLSVLGLQKGASLKAIKSAYRKLSKLYHPDLNTDQEAHQKFIEITEAYQFLLRYSKSTHSSSTKQTSSNQSFDSWRAEARNYAKKRAYEEARLQQTLMRKILFSFNTLAFVIAFFNVFLTVDYLLPKLVGMQKISQIEKLMETTRQYAIHKNDAVEFEDFDMLFKANYVFGKIDVMQAQVERTRFLKVPVAAIFQINGRMVRFEQAYGIYHNFGIIIPLSLLGLFLYHYVFRTIENKFTMALVLFLSFAFQLSLYFMN